MSDLIKKILTEEAARTPETIEQEAIRYTELAAPWQD